MNDWIESIGNLRALLFGSSTGEIKYLAEICEELMVLNQKYLEDDIDKLITKYLSQLYKYMYQVTEANVRHMGLNLLDEIPFPYRS